jgi:hypothetical protein
VYKAQGQQSVSAATVCIFSIVHELVLQLLNSVSFISLLIESIDFTEAHACCMLRLLSHSFLCRAFLATPAAAFGCDASSLLTVYC